MSKIGLRLNINLSEIDMSQVFQGKKWKYLDCTIFVNQTELDQYGNSGMITQDVKGDSKGKILGNGKVFWVENGQAPSQQQSAPQQQGGGFQQQQPQQNTGGFQQQAPQQQYSNQTPQQQQQPYQQPAQQQGGFQQQQAPGK